MSDLAGFDISAYQQNTGERFVWLCERCGQPHAPGTRLCNSGIHVGPDEEANGEAIKSVDLVEKAQRTEGERNHAFALLRLILDAPYEPLPPGVLDTMRELVEK